MQLPPPELDTFGRVLAEAPPDQFPARSGIAMGIGHLTSCLPKDQIEPLFAFFVEKGLNDRHEEVRKHMLAAAVRAVDDHGKVRKQTLQFRRGFLQKI